MYIRVGLPYGHYTMCWQLCCITCLTLPSPCSSIELCNCWVEMTFPRSPITVELLENFSSEQRDSFSYRCFSEELFILEEWRNLNISAVVTKL